VGDAYPCISLDMLISYQHIRKCEELEPTLLWFGRCVDAFSGFQSGRVGMAHQLNRVTRVEDVIEEFGLNV